MRRVVVFGSGGAGKTTFSRRLGALLDLPVTHLDRLFWQPGWVSAPLEEFQTAQLEVVAGDRWIIDGNFSSTMHLRLPRADTVILLDYPRRTNVRRACLRIVRDYGQDKQAAGCPGRVDRDFLGWLWRWPRVSRPNVFAKVAEHGPHTRQLLFKTPAETEGFCRSLRTAHDPIG
jgi:adenylate kinase family enzyme